MNEAEKSAVEAQLHETSRRLNEVSEFYSALCLHGQAHDDMCEAMQGYRTATQRIMDLLAKAVTISREPSSLDDAEIQRNHRIRLAAMARLAGIAAQPLAH